MLGCIGKFFSYWYLRYLMACELYLLETWERHTAHALLLVLFLGFLYINSFIVSGLSSVAYSLMTSPDLPVTT